MYPKQSFILNIVNNTGADVPISILNAGNPNNDIINARTSYKWDISGITFVPPIFSIQVRRDPSQPFQTYTGRADSIASLLAALNQLNIGLFWIQVVGPVTYLVTYNDGLLYGDVTIGTAFTMQMNMNIIAPGTGIHVQVDGTGVISGTVDYGDGTTANFSQVGPVAFNHNYAAIGDYAVNFFFDDPTAITEVTTITGSRISSIIGLSEFPNLTVVGFLNTVLAAIDVTQNPALTNFSIIGSFGVPGQITTLDLSQNPLLTNLIVIQQPNFHGIDISVNTLLVQVSIQNTGLDAIDIGNNPQIIACALNNNSLLSANLDSILIDLDNAGLLNGSCSLFSQNPFATPGGAGLAAKASLQGKGWSVVNS